MIVAVIKHTVCRAVSASVRGNDSAADVNGICGAYSCPARMLPKWNSLLAVLPHHDLALDAQSDMALFERRGKTGELRLMAGRALRQSSGPARWAGNGGGCCWSGSEAGGHSASTRGILSGSERATAIR